VRPSELRTEPASDAHLALASVTPWGQELVTVSALLTARAKGRAWPSEFWTGPASAMRWELPSAFRKAQRLETRTGRQ
jgi:hypothetical protein